MAQPTPAQLRAECLTDPAALGLTALFAAGADAAVAAALNHPRDGTTPPPAGNLGAAITVTKDFVSTQELVEAVVQSEMPSNASQRDWLLMVASSQRVNVQAGSATRAGLLAIFPAGSASRTSITALAQRTGTRAEQAWGVPCRITDADVAAARNAA